MVFSELSGLHPFEQHEQQVYTPYLPVNGGAFDILDEGHCCVEFEFEVSDWVSD